MRREYLGVSEALKGSLEGTRCNLFMIFPKSLFQTYVILIYELLNAFYKHLFKAIICHNYWSVRVGATN